MIVGQIQKGEKMGRTLNEDDVLKEIDRWIGYLDEDMITRIKIGIKKLQSAQPEQRWIPCSEGLPNGQTEVIVSCRDDSSDAIYRYTASGWITTDGEYWIVDNEINPYVIAWCELPEPYREEGEQP